MGGDEGKGEAIIGYEFVILAVEAVLFRHAPIILESKEESQHNAFPNRFLIGITKKAPSSGATL
jgi:hypothetical protein